MLTGGIQWKEGLALSDCGIFIHDDCLLTSTGSASYPICSPSDYHRYLNDELKDHLAGGASAWSVSDSTFSGVFICMPSQFTTSSLIGSPENPKRDAVYLHPKVHGRTIPLGIAHCRQMEQDHQPLVYKE